MGVQIGNNNSNNIINNFEGNGNNFSPTNNINIYQYKEDIIKEIDTIAQIVQSHENMSQEDKKKIIYS